MKRLSLSGFSEAVYKDVALQRISANPKNGLTAQQAASLIEDSIRAQGASLAMLAKF